MRFCTLLGGAVGLLLAGAAPPALAGQTVLTVYAAGTLAPPFRQLDKVFEKQHPGVVVQPEFGGSVMLAKRITELHHRADVFASADYHVISDYLFPKSGLKGFASWYIGFVGNAITFARLCAFLCSGQAVSGSGDVLLDVELRGAALPALSS